MHMHWEKKVLECLTVVVGECSFQLWGWWGGGGGGGGGGGVAFNCGDGGMTLSTVGMGGYSFQLWGWKGM